MVYSAQSIGTQSLDHSIKRLKNDIQRFKKACLSEHARPIDYTNLIDAQFTLKTLGSV